MADGLVALLLLTDDWRGLVERADGGKLDEGPAMGDKRDELAAETGAAEETEMSLEATQQGPRRAFSSCARSWAFS